MTSTTPTSRKALTESQIARRNFLGRLDLKASPYLYIAPFFIVFAVVGLFPLLYTGYISLLKWDPILHSGKWLGIDNFVFVFNDSHFWVALRNTISIFLLSSVPQLIFALLIAAVLNTNLRARTFWQMGVLLPYVVMPVAIAIIFGQVFADQTGIVNHLLTTIGLPAVPWHTDAIPAQIAIAVMVNFRWTGYNALILLAGMQAIPRDLYEQASIDGANRIRQFFSITIPQLRPTLIFVVITSTIGGLQIFDEPQLYDTASRFPGGSDGQWLTLTGYIYGLGWVQTGQLSRAAAVAWVLFIIIVILAVANFLISSRIASNSSRVKAPKKIRKEAAR